MQKGKILIIDDNRSILTALDLLLQDKYQVISMYTNPNKITSIENLHTYDVVLLDMNFSAGINTGNEGFYWLKRLKEIAPDVSVIMITAYGDVALAVRSLKEGAMDFILKPWNNEKLLATIQSAFKLRQSRKEVSVLKQKQQHLKSIINQEQKYIIGNSRVINQLLDTVNKVAKTDANVLITGENGTGKELVAREIHRRSDRNEEILVKVDMGSIPESLFESELFGHLKGAFTDAHKDRAGKFEAANGGTIFLDEIGNLNYSLQSKLLTVLQNREVFRIGSNTPIPVNMRLVCATNANLEKMVEEGLFREDLLYRINTIYLEVPPLRDRDKDIALLANFFLKKYAYKYDKGNLTIAKTALKKLLNYKWPGNVRELQHTIERSVIMCDDKLLKEDDFLIKQRSNLPVAQMDTTIEEMEKLMISNALDKNNGNYTAAAQQLGITRQTLYNKSKRFNSK